jgi:hypothetical protein
VTVTEKKRGTEAKREKENNQRIQTKKYKWGDTEGKKRSEPVEKGGQKRKVETNKKTETGEKERRSKVNDVCLIHGIKYSM